MNSMAIDVRDLVDEHARINFSPSGILAVASEGTIVQQHTWGTDSYDLDTPFRIASCTKSFTALAILMLRRTGSVGLDDEASQHLPELRAVAEPGWPILRVRHLLAMSSGLATDNPWGDRQEAVTREQLSAWTAGGLRLMFPPGTAFEYSNLGYALLGEIVTRTSGQDYRDFVREHIINPLNLTSTRFAAHELPAVAPAWHRQPALPDQPGGWSPQAPSGPGAFSAIGGLYSSARDLIAWAHLYQSRVVPPGLGFTAADLIEAQEPLGMTVPSMAQAPLHGPVASGYGFGLAIEHYGQHGKLLSHAGGYPGCTSYMCWHAESGLSIVASANGTHSAASLLARQAMLRQLAQYKVIPESADPWDETTTAIERITSLVHKVAHTTPNLLAEQHAGLFADNFELDFPLKHRIEHLQFALRNLGALTDRSQAPTIERPCRAAWTVAAEHGVLELFVELAPVAPFQVQTFSATMINGAARIKLF